MTGVVLSIFGNTIGRSHVIPANLVLLIPAFIASSLIYVAVRQFRDSEKLRKYFFSFPNAFLAFTSYGIIPGALQAGAEDMYDLFYGVVAVFNLIFVAIFGVYYSAQYLGDKYPKLAFWK